LFNHEHTGWHRSGFYPQIYADCADFLGIARVFWNARGEFLIFMKFHVFHGFIQIGVGIGIAIGIGIDCYARAVARSDKCNDGGDPDPDSDPDTDSDDAAMEP